MFSITLKDVQVDEANICKHTSENDSTIRPDQEIYKLRFRLNSEIYQILLKKLSEHIPDIENIILPELSNEFLRIQIYPRDKVTVHEDIKISTLRLPHGYTYDARSLCFLEQGQYFIKDFYSQNITYKVVCDITFNNIETLLRGSERSLRIYASWESTVVNRVSEISIHTVYAVSEELTTNQL